MTNSGEPLNIMDRITTVRKMFKVGMTVDEIAETTKFSIEDVIAILEGFSPESDVHTNLLESKKETSA